MSINFLKRKFHLTKTISQETVFSFHQIENEILIQGSNIQIDKSTDIIFEIETNKEVVGLLLSYLLLKDIDVKTQSNNISKETKIKTFVNFTGNIYYNLVHDIKVTDNNISIDKNTKLKVFYLPEGSQASSVSSKHFLNKDIITKDNNIQINKQVNYDTKIYFINSTSVFIETEKEINKEVMVQKNNISINKTINQEVDFNQIFSLSLSISLTKNISKDITTQTNNIQVNKNMDEKINFDEAFILYSSLITEQYLTKDITTQTNNIQVNKNMDEKINFDNIQSLSLSVSFVKNISKDITTQTNNIQISKYNDLKTVVTQIFSLATSLSLGKQITRNIVTQTNNIQISKLIDYDGATDTRHHVSVFLSSIKNLTKDITTQTNNIQVNKNMDEKINFDEAFILYSSLITEQYLTKDITTQTNNIQVNKNMDEKINFDNIQSLSLSVSFVKNISKDITTQTNNIQISKNVYFNNNFTSARDIKLYLSNLSYNFNKNILTQSLIVNKTKQISGIIENISTQTSRPILAYIDIYDLQNNFIARSDVEDRPLYFEFTKNGTASIKYSDNNEFIRSFAGNYQYKIILNKNYGHNFNTDLSFVGDYGTTNFENILFEEILLQLGSEYKAYIGEVLVNKITSSGTLKMSLNWKTPKAKVITSKPLLERRVSGTTVEVRAKNNDSQLSDVYIKKGTGTNTKFKSILPYTYTSWFSMQCSNTNCPTYAYAEAISPGKNLSSSASIALNIQEKTSRPTIEKRVVSGTVQVRFYNNDANDVDMYYYKTGESETKIGGVTPGWTSWISMGCSDGSCPTNVSVYAKAINKTNSNTTSMTLNTPQFTWQIKGNQSGVPNICFDPGYNMLGLSCSTLNSEQVVSGASIGYSQNCVILICK